MFKIGAAIAVMVISSGASASELCGKVSRQTSAEGPGRWNYLVGGTVLRGSEAVLADQFSQAVGKDICVQGSRLEQGFSIEKASASFPRRLI